MSATFNGALNPELLPPRIMRRIRIEGQHWIWTGAINNKGYGLVCWRGTNRAAHKSVYEILVGPVPDGLELDHLCRITACVNPSCLEPVTHAENQRRGGLALTHCRRAGHPRTPENTYIYPHGGKRCRPCARESDQRRAPRRRAA